MVDANQFYPQINEKSVLLGTFYYYIPLQFHLVVTMNGYDTGISNATTVNTNNGTINFNKSCISCAQICWRTLKLSIIFHNDISFTGVTRWCDDRFNIILAGSLRDINTETTTKGTVGFTNKSACFARIAWWTCKFLVVSLEDLLILLEAQSIWLLVSLFMRCSLGEWLRPEELLALLDPLGEVYWLFPYHVRNLW